ncbi:MAG: terminase [Brevibacterium yomogidense]
MAVARSAAGPSLVRSRESEKLEIVDWYRDLLERTAPPAGLRWEPVRIGPTWQWSEDDGWLLPEATLGWEFLAWTGMWLRGKRGPWAWTAEQARFLLWYFALTESGEFDYHSAALQRLKGWGKDPLAAGLGVGACFAPIQFDRWDGDRPVGREEPDAWVQIVAVSQDQTKNTMKLLPGLVPAETRRYYGIQIGKLSMWGLGDTRQIEAVTASPLALEGGRPTQIIRNETQNWNSSNGGHDMDGVLEGNAAKRDVDSPARILDIFNAYRPGEDSVAERVRAAWESTQGDPDAEDEHLRPKHMDFGLLYDSLEAPPEAPLTADAAVEVVESIRGDADWLDAKGRVLKSILNPKNPPSESRRKWYNQITAAEDAWVTPQQWDQLARPDLVLEVREEVALFLDCSKSDDATALMVCRISDGLVMVGGLWQKPPGERGKGWLVPREKVDATVQELDRKYTVVGFFGDPSHVLDDETVDRYWDAMFDTWHRRLRAKLRVWASPGKDRGHSVMFDMALLDRQKAFVEALSIAEADIESGELIHDGDPRLRQHVLNAKRQPTKAGASIAKEHRESRKKIDLAVSMVGARMVRRLYLNSRENRSGRGRVW